MSFSEVAKCFCTTRVSLKRTKVKFWIFLRRMMHVLGLTRSVSRQFEMQIMLVQQNGVGQIPVHPVTGTIGAKISVNGMKRFTRVASSHTSLERSVQLPHH